MSRDATGRPQCWQRPRRLLATGQGCPIHPLKTMSTVKTTLQADWAPALEQLARQAAIALVAVYAAGWWLGRQVHDLNNWLAGKRPPAPEPTNTLLLDVRALRNAGLTHREIGQELKISQGRVRQLLRTEK